MKMYRFDINPVAKPRMTQSDKWKNRPIVTKYHGYADLLRLQANKQGLKTLPGVIEAIRFYIKMPESWSEKKKREMYLKPHRQTPDLSNLIKSVEDVLCKDDSHIWKYNGLKKVWSYEGWVIIFLDE